MSGPIERIERAEFSVRSFHFRNQTKNGQEVMDLSKEGNREVRVRMGLNAHGELPEDDGLSRDAMATVMDKARAATVNKKRDRSKPSGRKRGGQPGNQNGAGAHGIYSRVKGFEARFSDYSRALGKASAQEEVALTRSMVKNLLKGYDPLGCGEIDDAEVLIAYMRDFLMLNLKAQELYMRQEAKRLEQAEKNGAKAGVEIRMSAEMEKAMSGMVGAQDAAERVSADEMLACAKAQTGEAVRPPGDGDGDVVTDA